MTKNLSESTNATPETGEPVADEARAREVFATECEKHGYAEQAANIRRNEISYEDGGRVCVDAMLAFARDPSTLGGGEPVARLIAWARQEQALPSGSGAGWGHIDENHRFKLRDMIDAIDAAAPLATSPAQAAGREEIARLVNEHAWFWHDKWMAEAETEKMAGRAGNLRKDAKEHVAPSLAKADRILALTPPAPDVRALREALELARPIVEGDWLTAKDYGDADWEGVSFTALEAIDAALARGEKA